MANPEEIKAVIRSFLAESLGVQPGALNDDTPLISSHVVDSITALKLVNYLEQKFGVEFAAHEVDQDILNTINSITAFLQSKLK